jgi:hypothetical protein
VAWAGEVEHFALINTARDLMSELEALQGRHVTEGVHHANHGDYGERAQQLAQQLRAADSLAITDRYGPALGSLRVGLEHVMVDSLVFLGDRWQRGKGISEATWLGWVRERQAGEPWTRDIIEWSRDTNGSVRIVREGIRSEDGTQVISIFYFLLGEYVPWLGPPDAQDLVEDGLVSLEDRRERARKNRSYYRQYLSWGAIKGNLVLNGLATSEDVARLDVHYRYLSGFVHPIAHTAQDLYGRNARAPLYDHFSSELVFFYICVFAIRELENFRRMTDRSPRLRLRDWAAVERKLSDARHACAHLWLSWLVPVLARPGEGCQRAGLRSARDGFPCRSPRRPR